MVEPPPRGGCRSDGNTMPKDGAHPIDKHVGSRVRHISDILQVPVEFFFEGAPHVRGQDHAQTDAPSPQYVADFLATSDGLHLTKAFMHIQNARLRHSIVNLVEQIASPEENDGGAA